VTLKQRISHFRNAISGSALAYRPGHFYSPICNPDETVRYYCAPTSKEIPLPGIELNKEAQIVRWSKWRVQLSDYIFSTEPRSSHRYFSNNSQYGCSDAVTLHCMIRDLSPKRIIEIGCGMSSACILDTLERYNIGADCIFIDPHPEALRAILKSDDHPQIISKKVQDVPLDLFLRLGPRDMLVIDSTHVLKTASDLNFELFELLPYLQSGVFIQFHDMIYPFEYNEDWVLRRNYSWNEIYAMRAYLMYNAQFRIEFWNNYLIKTMPELFAGDEFQAMRRYPGGSLWVSRT
jgi:hypothetical protein